MTTDSQPDYIAQFVFPKTNLWTQIQNFLVKRLFLYRSKITAVLFLKRVLSFHETRSNLLGALHLLTHTSVSSSFITAPSLLSANMLLSSFKTHLQGDFPASFCVSSYNPHPCMCVCKHTDAHIYY